MSFDIEASSSHGDFPVPIKSYKKLATNIVDYFSKLEDKSIDLNREECKKILNEIVRAAFGKNPMDNIDLVYPKEQLKDESDLQKRTENWLKTKVIDRKDVSNEEHLIESLFESANKAMQTKEKEEEKDKDNSDDDDSDNEGNEIIEEKYYKIGSGLNYEQNYKNKESTIVDIMCDKKFGREGKISELIRSLRNNFPALEGDKVTFIGSTFMNYGDKEPYLNHCIVLNSCSKIPMENSVIESYNTEKEVLLAWQKFVQRENPDIIIGYNIFGFDYEFLFRRAEENDCVEEFLKLSRNKDEICGTKDKDTGKWKIEESSIQIASGQHDLRFIKMNGRLQVDLYNFYRRSENLTSYKLDYVAGK